MANAQILKTTLRGKGLGNLTVRKHAEVLEF